MRINIPRLLSTTTLLALVWMNSHWSIAVSLFLLGLNDGFIRRALVKEIRYRKERSRTERKIFIKLKKLRQDYNKFAGK